MIISSSIKIAMSILIIFKQKHFKKIFYASTFYMTFIGLVHAETTAAADDGRLVRQEVGFVEGTITSLTTEGYFVIDNTDTVRQWGLQVKRSQHIDWLLLGRTITCRIQYSVGEIYTGDCSLYSRAESATHLDKISLFVWLPSLDLASPYCSEADISQSGAMNLGGFSYFCYDFKGPYRYLN